MTITQSGTSVRLASAVLAGVLMVTAAANAQQVPADLADTAWRLVEFQSMDDAIGIERPGDPSQYTMQLAADGSVSMRLNCNRASGSWSAEAGADGSSGSFGFNPLAMTRALCPPPSMDESLARQAGFIRSFLLRNGRLYLSLMADGGIYVWEPDPAFVVPPSPDDGGARVFVVTGVSTALNLRAEPSTAAAVVARVADGAWLDNLGCQAGSDRAWCDVQRFGGGPRAYVAAEYLAPALGPDGSPATGPDDSALRAGQGDFDASGQLPCAQAAGQPLRDCAFSVARAGSGFAAVVITRPDGGSRMIFFRMGVPSSAAQSEAEGFFDFSFTKDGDLNLIRVGAERYEIPDAVILGG